MMALTMFGNHHGSFDEGAPFQTAFDDVLEHLHAHGRNRIVSYVTQKKALAIPARKTKARTVQLSDPAAMYHQPLAHHLRPPGDAPMRFAPSTYCSQDSGCGDTTKVVNSSSGCVQTKPNCSVSALGNTKT